MSSTSFVDFSVRQNKAIERKVVVDGLRQLIGTFGLQDFVYFGLGSVWFTDFKLVHRDLGGTQMISAESDPIVFKRALYNRPYSVVEVLEGSSADRLPEALASPGLSDRPWVVWLDYDQAIDEDKLAELEWLVTNLPENSCILTTFNAQLHRYAKLQDRYVRLKNLFGSALPPEKPTNSDLKNEVRFMQVLAYAVDAFIESRALKSGRLGGYRSAFKVKYQDGAPMVTVGGFLPSVANEATAREMLERSDWPALLDMPIATPPLTRREVEAMMQRLPATGSLSRADIQSLGFDLDDGQIGAFCAHYLRYPTFAEIAS